MNSLLKTVFLLGLVLMSSGDVIQQNLANLRAQMQAASFAASSLTKIQALQSEQNSSNTSPTTTTTTRAQTPPATPTRTPSDQNATTGSGSPAQNTGNNAPADTSSETIGNTTQQSTDNTTSSVGMTITLDQLEQIMPNSGNNSAYYLPYINDAMASGGINNCPRIAAFLAQIGHESGSLVYTTEIADGSAYEGIADIGNTSPGDGVKYKGRGLIQVTGKYNYQIVSQGLGHDFVSDPTALANVPYCVTSAVWWWNNHTLSPIADANTQDSFDQITRIINGGYNGKADRDSRWATAKQVLGC